MARTLQEIQQCCLFVFLVTSEIWKIKPRVESESFRNLLAPVVMEKIPSELRLIISRKFGSKETWDLDVLLNALKSEFQPILILDVISIRED